MQSNHNLPLTTKTTQPIFRACTATALLLVAGCDFNDGRIPASGVVLIDGEPLTHGTVRLFPKGSRSASGKLDEDGKFVLNTKHDQKGILPGTHRVKVDAREWVGPRSLKWHAPKKYASHNSGLEVTIDETKEEITIDLTWDGKKPFVENLGGVASESW